MKSLMVALVVAAGFAVPAQALSPETEAFLRKAGLDPASEAVRIAEEDGTIVTMYRDDEKRISLESLAKEGAKNGIKSFVATRAFIRKLKADFAGTPFLKTNYDGLYLTLEERRLATRKAIES